MKKGKKEKTKKRFTFPTFILLPAILLAETQCLYNGTVTVDVTVVEIVEQSAALAYELRQRTSRNIVFVVLLHVLGQVLDTISEKRNLTLCRTRVCRVLCLAVLCENLLFLSLV